MERRAYHHGDLVTALTAAGLELLETDGVEGLSLRAVARAAGVSPNAPYRHFHDKNDLLAAIARRGADDLRADIETVTGDSARDRLIGVVQAGVKFALDRPQMFRLMASHACSSHPLVQSAVREAQAAAVRVMRGPGRQIPQDVLSTAVLALIQGISALMLSGTVHPGPGESTDDLVRRVVEATAAALSQSE